MKHERADYMLCLINAVLCRYKGFAGTIGHEFVGVIEAFAPNTKTALCVGQRVAAEINCVSEECGCRNYHERAQHPDVGCQSYNLPHSCFRPFTFMRGVVGGGVRTCQV